MATNVKIQPLPSQLATRIREYQDFLAILEGVGPFSLAISAAAALPQVPAIYVVRDKQRVALAVGETPDLREHITALVTGDPSGQPLIGRLANHLSTDRGGAQAHLRDHCSIQFMLADQYKSNSHFAQFAVAILEPVLNG